ncbi:fluoride efflux transporter CrcB [Nocardioides terrisoli]|uniref:fluoride efflux transporter CrcB n=1 Tax=Nocardioides terrisoli TaxID=3388267 RepID=UPI00287B5DCD|nr:fluoride efflux transporter CrcB [Nocardioides marmorisolisilvae]
MFGRDPREILAIFVGGAVGALARGLLAEAVPAHPGEWPWATFVANVVAAFLLGYFTTRLLERLPVSTYRRPFLGTGICGGLSTFSTMQVELVRMLQAGAWAVGLGYLLASLVCGLLAMHLATGLVRRVALR